MEKCLYGYIFIHCIIYKKNRYRWMMHTPTKTIFSFSTFSTHTQNNNNIETQYYSRSMTLWNDGRVRWRDKIICIDLAVREVNKTSYFIQALLLSLHSEKNNFFFIFPFILNMNFVWEFYLNFLRQTSNPLTWLMMIVRYPLSTYTQQIFEIVFLWEST